MKLAAPHRNNRLSQHGRTEPRQGVPQEGELRKSFEKRGNIQTECQSTDLDEDSTRRIHISLHNGRTGASFHPYDSDLHGATAGLRIDQTDGAANGKMQVAYRGVDFIELFLGIERDQLEGFF
jgi:hypothetical protein